MRLKVEETKAGSNLKIEEEEEETREEERNKSNRGGKNENAGDGIKETRKRTAGAEAGELQVPKKRKRRARRPALKGYQEEEEMENPCTRCEKQGMRCFPQKAPGYSCKRCTIVKVCSHTNLAIRNHWEKEDRENRNRNKAHQQKSQRPCAAAIFQRHYRSHSSGASPSTSHKRSRLQHTLVNRESPRRREDRGVTLSVILQRLDKLESRLSRKIRHLNRKVDNYVEYLDELKVLKKNLLRELKGKYKEESGEEEEEEDTSESEESDFGI